MSCVSDVLNHKATPWVVGTLAVATTITMVVLNALAVNGHFNALTIGAINTAMFGAAAVISIAALAIFFDKTDSTWQKIAMIAALLINTLLTVLSSLGIAGVFSAHSVGWTYLAPFIINVGLGVIGGTTVAILKCQGKI